MWKFSSKLGIQIQHGILNHRIWQHHCKIHQLINALIRCTQALFNIVKFEKNHYPITIQDHKTISRTFQEVWLN